MSGGSALRNDPDGIAVIKWWRERCIEWCYDYVDGDRFADQGYLDSFSGRSARVKVIENSEQISRPGISATTAIDFRDGTVMIDAIHPLVFFHFQGLQKGLRLVHLQQPPSFWRAVSSATCAITSIGPTSTNC